MTDWLPISDAKTDGTLYALRFQDRLGVYDSEPNFQFFLHDDGHWYGAETERRITVRVIACKPPPKETL